jgi:hypothetical protein
MEELGCLEKFGDTLRERTVGHCVSVVLCGCYVFAVCICARDKKRAISER